MKKFQMSQLAKLVLLLLFFLITPFVSTSMRTSYLYFLLNILIVALGVEAGLLRAISGPSEEKKLTVTILAPSHVEVLPNNLHKGGDQQPVKPVEKPVEKMAVEKIAVVARVKKVKRCPSMPSLFFIGSCDDEGEFKEEEVGEEEEEEEVGGLSGQELFAKAEMFIGNFYKQLKIQREESWKKIHGVYHKAF